LTEEKIVGNSQDLVSLFEEFYGSSGTSDSFRALPDKISKENPKLIKQEGVDGAVLLSLIDTYKEGDIIDYEDNGGMAKKIAEELQKTKASALIDLAPAFPGITGKGIASALSKELKNTPLRFIDRDDKVKGYDPETQSTHQNQMNIAETITLFDQVHTRGTDLVLDNKSIGYVTVGPKTKFSDFLQAVMRMRKLGKGQKVRYLIDPATKKRMLGQGLEGLIALLVDNEAEALKKVHFKAEKQKIQAIAKVALFKRLHRIKDPHMRTQLWQQCRGYFIQPTQESLSNQGIPRVKEDASAVLIEVAKQEKDRLSLLVGTIQYPNFNEALQEAIGKLDKKISEETLINKKYLPKKVYHTTREQDFQQEVEKEQEKEQEQEQEQEQQQEQVVKRSEELGVRWHVFAIADTSELINKLNTPNHGDFHRVSQYVPYYDQHLFFTENCYHTQKQMQPWGAQNPSEKLPEGQTRISRFVMLVDKREATPKIYTVLGTPKDFDHVLEKLDASQKTEGIDFYIYNLNQDDLDGRESAWKEYSEELQKEIVRTIVQVKLLAGEIDLLSPPENVAWTRQESKAFESWVREKKEAQLLNVPHLESNLKKYLRAMRPSIAEEYKNSKMAKILRACSKTSIR
jgi:ribosomal protein L21E